MQSARSLFQSSLSRPARLAALALAFSASPWSALAQEAQPTTDPVAQALARRALPGNARVSTPRPMRGTGITRVIAPVETTSEPTIILPPQGPAPATPTVVTPTTPPSTPPGTPEQPVIITGSAQAYRVSTPSNVTPPTPERRVGVRTRVGVPAPSGLVASGLESGVRLSWNNVRGETGFLVQRVTRDGLRWSNLREARTNQDSLSTLDRPEAGVYAYRVASAVNSLRSDFGDWMVIEVRPPAPQIIDGGNTPNNPNPSGPPSTPEGVSISDSGARSARITWTLPATSGPAASIQIERDPAFARPVAVSAGVTTYVDRTGAGTFQYRLRAVGPQGSSAMTAWTSVTVREQAPTAPTGLAADNLGNFSDVRLSWGDTSDNETRFVIQSQSRRDGVWSDNPTVITLADATQQVVSPGPGEHRFRVLAQNSAGSSPASEVVGVTIDPQPAPGGTAPSAPRDLRVSLASQTQATLTWTDSSDNEVAFELERDPAFPNGRVRVAANQGLFTDTARVGVTSYRVRAVSATGEASGFTDWVSLTVNASAPSAPSGLLATAQGDGTGVLLRWDDNSADETGFVLEHQQRASLGWGPTRVVRLASNATEHLDRPGRGEHRYRLSAVGDVGPSAFTPWSEVTVGGDTGDPTLVPPTAPTDVVALDQGNRRAGVVWTDTSSNETGFEVERSPALPAQAILPVGSGAFLDDCGPGQFSYRVRALGEAGNSEWSEWASVSVADTPPNAPSNLRALDAGDQVRVEVAWTDTSANEAGFRLLRSSFSSGAWGGETVITLPPNTTTYEDTPGPGRHRYRVVSFNAGGERATDWTTVAVTTGWTSIPLPVGARQIYVSSSLGNDANDGLSPDRPKRKIVEGFRLLRDGSGDQLLLRRGDVWVNEHVGDMYQNEFAGFNKSGRSAEEPLVVATYGDDPRRPLIKTGTGPFAINFQRQDGLSHVWIIGLHFQANTRLPGPDYIVENAQTDTVAGIRFYVAGEDFLFEDMLVENYTGAFSITASQGPGSLRDVRLRRSVIVDNFPTVTGHSSGLFITGVDGFLVDECVFDKNGWTDVIPGRESTIFNHNMYLEQSTTNVLVRNTISARASATGIQMRGRHMTAQNNLLLDNPLGIVGGHLQAVVGQEWTGAMLDNVILGSGDIGVGSTMRPHGFGIMFGRGRGARIEGNILAHNTTSFGLEPAIASDRQLNLNTTVANNIVYNWIANNPSGKSLCFRAGHAFDPSMRVTNNVFMQPNGGALVHSVAPVPGGTWSGNTYFSTAPSDSHALVGEQLVNIQTWIGAAQELNARTQSISFPDPNRGVASYMQTLGMTPSLDAFLTEARKQSKSHWRTEFTAQAVNAFVREGFGRPSEPTTPLTSGGTN